jgi:RNA polymerase sigma-70 factor (ECF subfamily)
MMHHRFTREGVSEPEVGLSDPGPLQTDREEMGRNLEACRPYLLGVANEEIGPVLRPKGGASDLVQQTFMEAIRDLSQFSGQSQRELRGWLRRILLNNLANFVRRYRGSSKRQIGREVSLDGDFSGGHPGDGLASYSPSPSSQAILSEDLTRLEHAMDQLKERDRLVLIWRIHDCCDWKEIGRRIGGSEEKARKVGTRAVERLRKLVDEA